MSNSKSAAHPDNIIWHDELRTIDEVTIGAHAHKAGRVIARIGGGKGSVSIMLQLTPDEADMLADMLHASAGAARGKPPLTLPFDHPDAT